MYIHIYWHFYCFMSYLFIPFPYFLIGDYIFFKVWFVGNLIANISSSLTFAFQFCLWCFLPWRKFWKKFYLLCNHTPFLCFSFYAFVLHVILSVSLSFLLVYATYKGSTFFLNGQPVFWYRFSPVAWKSYAHVSLPVSSDAHSQESVQLWLFLFP